MSVQGDQVVYDYLSRVGDAAHGLLTPSRRATLVAELRARIESQRAESGADEPEEVRLLLRQLGDPRSLVAEEVRRSPEHVIRRTERSLDPSTPSPGGAPTVSATGSRTVPPAGPRLPGAPSGGTPDADSTEQIPVVPAVERPSEPVSEDGSPWWRPTTPTTTPPASDATVTVSPAEDDDAADGGYGFGPGLPSSLGDLRGTLGRAQKREAFTILLLVVAALLSSYIVLVVGYLVAMTSRVWSQADKRTVVLGVPVLTVAVFGTTLWLRATGRIGEGRLGQRGEESVVHVATDYLVNLPRAIGLIAALYLGWRLLRGPRAAELRRLGPPR